MEGEAATEAEPEEIPVPETDVESEEEQEETERFIQEQVTSALGDTYSEETLRKQEERAAQIRKAVPTRRRRRRKPGKRCGGRRPVEATVRNWKRTLIPKAQEPSEEGRAG